MPRPPAAHPLLEDVYALASPELQLGLMYKPKFLNTYLISNGSMFEQYGSIAM